MSFGVRWGIGLAAAVTVVACTGTAPGPATKPKPKLTASASPVASPSPSASASAASPSPSPTRSPSPSPSPTPTPSPSPSISPSPSPTPSAAATDAGASGAALPKSARELYVVGRKLVYTSTVSGATSATGTLTEEVTAVDGNTASITVTNEIAGTKQVTPCTLDLNDELALPIAVGGPSPAATPAPDPSPQSVTIPLGTFSCTRQRFVHPPETEDRYFAKGLGQIKQVIVNSRNATTTTLELQSL